MKSSEERIIEHYQSSGMRLSPMTIFHDGSGGFYVKGADTNIFLGISKATAATKMRNNHVSPIEDVKNPRLNIYRLQELAAISKYFIPYFSNNMAEVKDDGKKKASIDDISIDEAKRRAEIEKVKNLQLKNAALLGEMIASDEVDRELATQAALHISLLRNEQAVFPNLLEGKSREDIDRIVRQYHHEEIERLNGIIEKRSKEKLGAPVLSNLIYGVIKKLSDGESIEDMMEKLGIDYDGEVCEYSAIESKDEDVS